MTILCNTAKYYWLRAFNPNTKPIHVWFVRGSMCDVMYIEKAYLSSIKDINWSIHIEPINRDWFIYWRVSASVSEGRFETTEKEGVKEGVKGTVLLTAF